MGLQLTEQGHELRMICGSPPAHEQSKDDNVISSHLFCVVEKSWWFFNGKLHFLDHALSHILWVDFIITEQANKHMHNYLLMVFRMLGFKPYAYWGHGQNRQGNPNSWREQIKKKLSTQCDWWFAYTEGVKEHMAGSGYPGSKITVLNNSIDSSGFKRHLSIRENAKVGLFCGGLYTDKKLEFLLNAALIIHQHNPDFVLLLAGNGNDQPLVEDFAQQHSFIEYLGPLFGEQKALEFKSADLFLCPGLAGLVILDAFTAALTLFTCVHSYHSPEIEYLQHGFNGLMTTAHEDDYAQDVIDILSPSNELAQLQKNALASSSRFSIENMMQQFLEGIQNYFKIQAG